MVRKYKLDENAFNDVKDEYAAYWLGFIFADGSVVGNVLRVDLSSKDKNHLYKLRRFLQSSQPLYERKNRNTHGLAICSKMTVSNLHQLGCMPRKTYDLSYPDFLPQNLERHFIRGFFDGDGSIGISDRVDRRRGKEYRHKELKIRLCGTLGMLVPIQVILKRETNCLSKIGPTTGTYLLQINRFEDVQCVLDHLYCDAKIYLTRKRAQYFRAIGLTHPKGSHEKGVIYATKKELTNNFEEIKRLYGEKKSCRAVTRFLRARGFHTSYHTIIKLLRDNGVVVDTHPSGWERNTPSK